MNTSQKSPILTRVVTLLRILAQFLFPQSKMAKEKNSPVPSRRTEFGQMATKSQRSQAVFSFWCCSERCWIAEKDGVRVGAVFVAKKSDEVVKLRLLHVEGVGAN